MGKILPGLFWLLGLALAQGGHSDMPMGAPPAGMVMTSMSELNRLLAKDFDIAYMSMMIEHHRGAVQMAQQALKASRDSRVRKAAQDIIAVQNKEIGQLTGWLRGWYKVAPSQRYMTLMRSDMKAVMNTAMEGMTSMKGMEMPVDRSFLEGMIPHHQDAVAMSQSCLKRAAKAELKQFCQGVITVQNKEITQYRAWLKTLR